MPLLLTARRCSRPIQAFAFFPLSDDSFLYGVLLLLSSIETLMTRKRSPSPSFRGNCGILRTYDFSFFKKNALPNSPPYRTGVPYSTMEPRYPHNIALIAARPQCLVRNIRLDLPSEIQRETSHTGPSNLDRGEVLDLETRSAPQTVHISRHYDGNNTSDASVALSFPLP